MGTSTRTTGTALEKERPDAVQDSQLLQQFPDRQHYFETQIRQPDSTWTLSEKETLCYVSKTHPGHIDKPKYMRHETIISTKKHRFRFVPPDT